jgi:methylmalonyl-CoA mutase cobalamin-binding domain/chain
MTQQELLQEISGKVQAGRAKAAKELVQQAIEEGIPAQQILEEGLLAGLNVIGVKFKNNEVFVPEVLIAARAMNQGVGILKPLLAQSETKVSGRVCIGTVKGDLHDIGKNLVKIMLEGKGLDVIDMGVDVAPEAFIQTAIDQDCQIIMCSALLTTTMGVMGDVVAGAEKAGIRDRVKIMVGGAPVTETFCQQIGADAYTPDATSAAEKAVEFCKEILG